MATYDMHMQQATSTAQIAEGKKYSNWSCQYYWNRSSHLTGFGVNISNTQSRKPSLCQASSPSALESRVYMPCKALPFRPVFIALQAGQSSPVDSSTCQVLFAGSVGDGAEPGRRCRSNVIYSGQDYQSLNQLRHPCSVVPRPLFALYSDGITFCVLSIEDKEICLIHHYHQPMRIVPGAQVNVAE